MNLILKVHLWVLKTKQLMNERVASLDSDVGNEVNLVHQNWI